MAEPKFDFDMPVDRRGSGSMKWDGEGDAPDVLQLWVADMDFPTAPVVRRAVEERAASGVFGYVAVSDSYYEALSGWFFRRHGWMIRRDRVIYTSGVVPAISAIIKALARPGDGVITQTPAYNCFFSSVSNQGCRLIDNPLRKVPTENGFTYELDFDDLERAAALPEARLLLLCNPHNPGGRVWSREELERVRDICRRNDVTVISDEIHCELVHPGSPAYVPYATVDSRAVVCCSPSKAFNIAGLQIANIVCPDEETRARVDRAINDNEVCDVNPFGVVALQAAYSDDGAEWLDALNEYLDGNRRLLRDSLSKAFPALRFCDSEATYLAWIDVSPLGLSGDRVADILLEEARVRVSSGSIYHDNSFIRINYATPRPLLAEAISRICVALEKNAN